MEKCWKEEDGGQKEEGIKAQLAGFRKRAQEWRDDGAWRKRAKEERQEEGEEEKH
jgi:hypothetical protein